MMNVKRTITIHRPIEEVFAYLCDLEQGPRPISAQQTAQRTSAGPIGVGTTFAISGKLVPWSRACAITEFEPNRRLAWQMMSGAHATTTWDLEPSGPSTRVTFTRVADPHGVAGFADSLMQRLENGRV